MPYEEDDEIIACKEYSGMIESKSTNFNVLITLINKVS
jgi:hypothetical protein